MKLCIFLGILALFLYLKHIQRSKICAELSPGVFDPAAVHLLNATCVRRLKIHGAQFLYCPICTPRLWWYTDQYIVHVHLYVSLKCSAQANMKQDGVTLILPISCAFQTSAQGSFFTSQVNS
ncbi:Hypothetical predicted protein [Podarcis lilfordi]|uniref:Secreted protein n=1 Tax=Podarcis lilfordi TaxID=74358 RepID=A0AA35PGY1_9SAUR|nr:Hypothetical predicted protein [Podarcis lilfordi]